MSDTDFYPEFNDPEYNPLTWDADRIEATKSILFAEYLASERSRPDDPMTAVSVGSG